MVTFITSYYNISWATLAISFNILSNNLKHFYNCKIASNLFVFEIIVTCLVK